MRLFDADAAHEASESVQIFHLDSDRHLLGRSIVAGGDEGAVDLPIRRIIGEALELGSSMLVIAHNHPSGDPAPSRADQLATRKLADIARALDIRLLDHMIVAGDRSYSFAESGLL
ncbi:DNA repair protein [Sphingomonas crocodyli]|uniref:DNA repair protein n=2 Tax=Sphingomonas crocodyli TaxID=1979270 RepID=A0A437M914_9SPHN|nr:DNA repair protein [Sphingomonas crocodyli]